MYLVRNFLTCRSNMRMEKSCSLTQNWSVICHNIYDVRNAKWRPFYIEVDQIWPAMWSAKIRNLRKCSVWKETSEKRRKSCWKKRLWNKMTWSIAPKRLFYMPSDVMLEHNQKRFRQVFFYRLTKVTRCWPYICREPTLQIAFRRHEIPVSHRTTCVAGISIIKQIYISL